MPILEDLYIPLRLAEFAILPAHYERDQRWQIKSGDNDTLQGPNRMTVNIGDSGYALLSQAELDLSQAATWDTQAPTDYTVAANRAGVNFYVYACQPGSGTIPDLLVSANSTVPSGYTADTSRKVAGFHSLCVATTIGVHNRGVGTVTVTVALPSGHRVKDFLTGDILPLSVWDLRHKVPPGLRQEGKVYDDRRNRWVDIYLASSTGVNTTSAFLATISDTRDWMDFVDDGFLSGSGRLLDDSEFSSMAYLSNEETNIAGSADPVTTGGWVDTAGRRMISDIGCEDCCGALCQWLRDQSYRFNGAASHTHVENTAASYTQNAVTQGPSADVAPAWAYYDLPGAKGSLYRQGTYGDAKLRAGGSWADGSDCGSRARSADYARWGAHASVGARFAAEPQHAES